MQSDRGRSVTKAEVRGNELHREDLRLRRCSKRCSIGPDYLNRLLGFMLDVSESESEISQSRLQHFIPSQDKNISPILSP